ncbi:LysR family transcriptional regulator [Vibrio splendidus]|uniref:Transcriptional regulator n=1 Tax=Vibrio splendidus TaxID=29497 RepID=A0A837NXU2_VIBSP|nr:LysR family transcriptional regulator [Vibrio splendidus]KPL95737.1 transcriptional regulator [Vibrio splendidus]
MNKDLDLNLLRILVLLDKHQQLKPVAKILGKSEASISKYLARLRDQLRDELFIRHAHHFESTDFLKEQLPAIQAGLDSLESCMGTSAFAPLTYDKPITISMPQVAQYFLGEVILNELFELLPNASINIVSPTDKPIESISDGNVDVYMHHFNEDCPKSIYQQPVGALPVGIVVPDDMEADSLETALSLPFIFLELKGWKGPKQVVRMILEKKGYQIESKVTVGDIGLLLRLLKRRRCATMMMNFGQSIDGFKFIEIPESYYSTGRPKIATYIKQTHRNNALHQLLISVIEKNLNLAQ